MIDINALESVPLFARLTNEEIQSIVDKGDLIELDGNEVLFEEDSEGRDIYLLVDGKITIESIIPGASIQKTKEFYTMKPNDVIGEFSYVDSAPRSATARAKRPSKLLHIRADALDALFEENKALGYKFMTNIAKTLCGRIRNANLALRNSLIWI